MPERETNEGRLVKKDIWRARRHQPSKARLRDKQRDTSEERHPKTPETIGQSGRHMKGNPEKSRESDTTSQSGLERGTETNKERHPESWTQ